MKFRKYLGKKKGRNPCLDVSIQLRPQKEEKPKGINLGCWMQKAFVRRRKCCHPHRIGCAAGPGTRCFISPLAPEARPGSCTITNKRVAWVRQAGVGSAGGCVPFLPSLSLSLLHSLPQNPALYSFLFLLSPLTFSFFRGGLEGVQDLGRGTTYEQISEASLLPTLAAVTHVFYFFSSAKRSQTHTNHVNIINISPDLSLSALESPWLPSCNLLVLKED